MATDETLEATYKVRYFVDPPLIPPQDDKLPILEHLKIKVELDKAWGERIRKRFQL